MREVADKKPTIGQIVAVGGGLLAFGLAFDQMTNQVNKRVEQRSSFLVVVGVAATVIVRQLLPTGLIYDFFAFACSGSPMIAGQLLRYERRRQRAEEHKRALT